MPVLRCRRCGCALLIRLKKQQPNDHDVFRCGECGYLFSPGSGPAEAVTGPGEEGPPQREDG